MDDLLDDFIAETREMLQNCEQELVAWEQNPSNKSHLDAIFRFVHTVKGNSGFFDFPRLTALSHAAEEALSEARAGRREPDKALVSSILAVIDRIMALVDALDNDAELPDEGEAALMASLGASGKAEPKSTQALSEQGEATNGSEPPTDASQCDTMQSAALAAARSIRVPTDLLDQVMAGVSDLVLSRNEMSRQLRKHTSVDDLQASFDRLSQLLDNVRANVTMMRMNRVEKLFQTLPRLVRDLSDELGKQVHITFDGSEVELDREVIELIRDPLTHIIRNALDHGFETTEERVVTGKPSTGTLTVSARHAGNEIRLSILDDGRGIDTVRLSEKAVSRSIIDRDQIDKLSHEQKLELIFAPGLSTAKETSQVSGRGVGMDIVRANVEKIGGRVEVHSTPGESTEFVLNLPLTLSIVEGLTVQCAGQQFAIAQAVIREIVRRRSSDATLCLVGETELVEIRGERIPYVSLSRTLGIETGKGVSDLADMLVIVSLSTNDSLAIGVDAISDHEDLVVKPLPPHILSTGYYAGLTLLDDGQPILLLDAREIARKAGAIADRGFQIENVEAKAETQARTAPMMLFTDLAGIRKAVRLPIVQRIEMLSPDRVDFAGPVPHVLFEDGTFLPVLGVSKGFEFDASLRALRLADGANELLLATSTNIETADVPIEDIRPTDEAGLEAIMIWQGKVIRLLDAHTLFASHRFREQHDDRPACKLPDDEWSRTILSPLVIEAGYRIADNDGERVDVIIRLAEQDMQTTREDDGRSIVLRSREAGPPSSVYRYDREGVLNALHQSRQAGGK